MSDIYSNIESQYDSPSKYNAKVLERKLKPQTDWAELVRNQQALAEKMIQQENDKRLVQRAELSDALRSMVNEKQTVRKHEDTMVRQQDYVDSMVKRQGYEQYLERSKNEKAEMQRALAAEYQRKQQEKEDERRRKVEHEKRVEAKMIEDALDSLQREKDMKDRKRQEFMQSVDQLMQDKEAQKRKEQERYQLDRQDNNRLINDNVASGERKDNNYKMYYQRLNDQQLNMQSAHEQKVTQLAKQRDQKIDDLINKGIEDARRKAEEEERLRVLKKQEQMRSMSDSIKQKINEHQEQQLKEKMEYQNKVQDIYRKNQELQNYNEQAQRFKANQVSEYKTILQSQMREAEDLKRRQDAQMLDHEKKMHLNQFEGLIPGIRNTKIDPINHRSSPHLGNLSLGVAGTPTSQAPGSYLANQGPGSYSANQGPTGYTSNQGPAGYTANQGPTSFTTNQGPAGYAANQGPTGFRASIDSQVRSPLSANSHSSQTLYNPITNPVPNNIQNPYLVKEYQTGSYNPRNYLAVTATKNLLGSGN